MSSQTGQSLLNPAVPAWRFCNSWSVTSNGVEDSSWMILLLLLVARWSVLNGIQIRQRKFQRKRTLPKDGYTAISIRYEKHLMRKTCSQLTKTNIQICSEIIKDACLRTFFIEPIRNMIIFLYFVRKVQKSVNEFRYQSYVILDWVFSLSRTACSGRTLNNSVRSSEFLLTLGRQQKRRRRIPWHFKSSMISATFLNSNITETTLEKATILV